MLISIGNNTISFQHLPLDSRSYSPARDHSSVSKLFLSPNGRYLLILHSGGSIELWDAQLDRQLHTIDENSTIFSKDAHIEYVPDSSWALLREGGQLLGLQIPAGLMYNISLSSKNHKISTLSYPTSKLLVTTPFPDSNRILIIQSNGNVTILSLHNMSRYSMPPLCSQLEEIRQLVISPTERLFIICSDIGLIVYETDNKSQHIPLFSNQLVGAGFSPDRTSLYTLETSGGRWMVSRVSTVDWAIQRVYAGEIDPFVGTWDSVNIVAEDGWSALKFSFYDSWGSSDLFVDLSNGKQIIPPSPLSNGSYLQYGNQWLMTLPIQKGRRWGINQYGLAYIHKGRAIVIDYSSLDASL
jgi:WD40 repeat protein